MNTTAALLFALVGSFLALRHVRQFAPSRDFPEWGVFLSGLLSWIFFLSAFGLAGWTVYLIVDVFASRDLKNLFVILFIGIGGGMLFSAKEAADAGSVVDFAQRAILFRRIASQEFLVDEELERKKIIEIHKEQTGKTLREPSKKQEFRSEEELRRLREEALALQRKPIRAIHLEHDLENLKAGQVVDLSDSWKINSFKRSTHDFYGNMSHVRINPQARTYSARVDFRDTTMEQLQRSATIFRLKQDLYNLLQAINTEEWLQPYAAYFERIILTCYGLQTDAFGLTSLYPFFRIDIPTSALQSLEGRIYSVTELHKISAITFNGGEPIE